MPGTDTAFINRTLGQVYTDLGYLVDVGVISDADYEQVIAKIPRRYQGGNALPNVGGLNMNTSIAAAPASANNGRRVPAPPQAAISANNVSTPPAYRGVGQAEALYEYKSGDAGDLHFRLGDKIVVLEYVNNDWWKGECNGVEGLFPSNYVKKVSDTGRPIEKITHEQAAQYPPLQANQYDPQQYQPVKYAPASTVDYAQTGSSHQQQQPVTVVQDKKSGKLNSIGGKLGNAALFGAGATIGGNIVNSIF